jgi:anti-sigma factor RsiW
MLNQLHNDESVLLLYLAGELPAQDRAEVDRRLSAEPRLREELGRLEAVHRAVTDWFGQADAALLAAAAPPANGDAAEPRGRSAAAVRRVSRAFVQRRATEEAARAAAAKNESMWPKSLLPRWAYPLTAAAAIVVGLLSLVQWGGSLVGSGRFNRSPWADMRGEEVPFSGGFRPSGIRTFVTTTYGLDEEDDASLELSAGAYDVSTMFQPDVN